MKNFDNVDDYIASFDSTQREELIRVRELVKKLVPEAIESTSYGMPAFKYSNKPLVYYAAFKDHYSIFPTSSPISSLKEKLENFKTGKGTIQYTKDNYLSDDLLKEIVLARLQELS